MADTNFHFSVVLCSHNGAAFIAEQIESILRQGDGIACVYVHDFASTDGTRLILDRLAAEHDGRLSVSCHADAPGAAASFLRALALTLPVLTDRSLVFLADQDDVWLPHKLATVRAALIERQLVPSEPFLLFHDVEVVAQDLRRLRPTYYTGNPFRLPRDLQRTRLLMVNPAIGHTMLLSVPLIRALVAWPNPDRYLMHDWLALLVAKEVGRVEPILTALSLYRQHDANVLGAYRANRPPSLERLLQFSDRVVEQALRFARASHALGARRPGPTSPFDRLFRQGYRLTAIALSIAAAIRGPTWQRKAIGLIFLVRAIVGPGATAT